MKLKQLVKQEAPYFHIAVGDTKLLYKLQIQARESNNIEFKVIRGQKCKSVTGLFNEWAAALQFPDYFGENWDAFDECLNDLDWLPADKYILFITNSHFILKRRTKDFKVLIDTLKDAIQSWTEGRYYDSFPTKPTPFHIIFHCDDVQKEAFQKRLIDIGVEEINILQLDEEGKCEEHYWRPEGFHPGENVFKNIPDKEKNNE